MTRKSDIIIVTPEYLKKHIYNLLGVSPKKAFSMLDNGELKGTVAEAELSLLRFVISKK